MGTAAVTLEVIGHPAVLSPDKLKIPEERKKEARYWKKCAELEGQTIALLHACNTAEANG
jgi:hypothetical protein